MISCIAEVTNAWRDGQTIDVLTEMMTITLRVTTETLFSGKLPTPLLKMFIEDVTTFHDSFHLYAFLPAPLDRLPSRGNRAYQRAKTRLRETVDQIIAERHREPTDRGDLLSALLAARDPETDGNGLTDAEISDTILAFFIAGTKTTATTLAWALHLLTKYPSIEKRLHSEIDAVITDGKVRYEDLPRLELTKRVFTEALRLYPPAWLSTRIVTCETELGEHLLPAGTTIAFSPYLLHHRGDLYDNPESFDPDRWDTSRSQPPANAFIAFSGGARKCVGDSFATTEATLALAHIASHWRLEESPGDPVRPILGLVLRPRKLQMKVLSRTRP